MGNTKELEREGVKTEPEAAQAGASAGAPPAASAGTQPGPSAQPREGVESVEEEGAATFEGAGTLVLNKAERRVVERLRRAKAIASMAAPELAPTLEDLVEIAELIEDAGG